MEARAGDQARDLSEKRAVLRGILGGMGRVVIAFSGGRDSMVLLAEAITALGRDNVLTVTAASEVHSPVEAEIAARAVADFGVRHVHLETDELAMPAFRANREDRCRVCKTHMFELIRDIAQAEGIEHVIEGINATEAEERPSLLSVPPEMGVRAPLAEAGLTEDDIAAIVRMEGLPVPESKSYCLASRVSAGILIGGPLLQQVREAEDYLSSLGFSRAVVRVHSDGLARIKVPPEQLSEFFKGSTAADVARTLEGLGFLNVSVDLDGT